MVTNARNAACSVSEQGKCDLPYGHSRSRHARKLDICRPVSYKSDPNQRLSRLKKKHNSLQGRSEFGAVPAAIGRSRQHRS